MENSVVNRFVANQLADIRVTVTWDIAFQMTRRNISPTNVAASNLNLPEVNRRLAFHSFFQAGLFIGYGGRLFKPKIDREIIGAEVAHVSAEINLAAGPVEGKSAGDLADVVEGVI